MLILSRSDIAQLLDVDAVIDAVEAGHAALAEGSAVQAPRLTVQLPDSDGLLVPMIAANGLVTTAGAKILTDCPDNAVTGAPRQQSTILLIDGCTGRCEALLDGAALTRVRTAAATAVATRHMSNPDSSTLGLIGAGALARTHIDAIRRVRPIKKVVLWARRRSAADELAAECAQLGVKATAVSSAEDVVRTADVLCTLTPPPEPLVRGAWLRAGMHINAVGAPPRPGFRELDSDAVARCRIVVDDRTVALNESDTLLIPLRESRISEHQLADELGDVITGAKPARRNPQDITLFNSVGIGIQDLSAARLVVDAAREKGLGVDIDVTR
ncbi:ornithine cyclodeaminase family protein [Streptomyces sp. Da 82-17]|uniref:ornithine cyclodeaminase family protein n=1 Tax=Streptomyces sp. Da 82-17 TaxID=3377116 RepID=UPI0038D43A00